MLEAHCGLQTYRSYLPSGADYFEAAPAHWLVVPGMLALTENRRDNKGMKESQVLSLSYGRIIVKAEEKLVGLVPESFETYQLAMPGDIIIRCTDLQNDQASLRTGLVKDRGIITSAYLCLGIREGFQNRYIHYLLHLLDISKAIYKLGSGLRQNLSFYDFKRLPVLKPSYAEQLLIADYLDQKSAQIDQAIQIKERQIERLKERKQMLIQQAVTRGLDPHVPMRDSGIEWIGEIPTHWQLKRLKHVLEECTDRSRYGEEPLFMVSQVHGLVVRSEYHEKAEVAASAVGNKIVREGDLVFNKLKAHLGVFFKSCIPFQGIVSPDYAVYRPKAHIEDLKYLEHLFRHPAYIGQFIIRATGVVEGLIRLYTTELFDIPVPVAPVDEQREILCFIETVSRRQDKAIALFEQQISKLKEYKATLINSAVTGKIKVPGVVEPATQDREVA